MASAPAASPLVLTDLNPFMFRAQRDGKVCTLAIPGSSGFELTPFYVTASGTVTPSQPCNLTITLYATGIPGLPGFATDPTDPANWVAIAASPAEPIDDTTMWMIQGTRLMYSLASEKMQGTFVSNVADNPTPEANLLSNVFGVYTSEPAMLFAVGAMVDLADADNPVTLTLNTFTLAS
jgi:hypothetical protein